MRKRVSPELARAQAAARTFLAEERRLVERHPDVREQLAVGVDFLLKEARAWALTHPQPSDKEIDDAGDVAWEQGQQMMRAVAEEQRTRRAAERPSRRGPRPALRSAIDGWRWRSSGRERKFSIPLLLLWVELQREGRPDLSRADALAEVMATDLERLRPAEFAKVQARRRQYERDDRLSASDALTKAMRALHRSAFRSLETQFSKALKRYARPR